MCLFLGRAGSRGPGTLARGSAASYGEKLRPREAQPRVQAHGGPAGSGPCSARGREPAPLTSLPRLREALGVQLMLSQALPACPGPGTPQTCTEEPTVCLAPQGGGTSRQAHTQLSGRLPPKLHLGPCPWRRGRQRPSVGNTRNSWASLAAGRPRALALALGVAARGLSRRGPQRLRSSRPVSAARTSQWQSRSSLPPGAQPPPRWAGLVASSPEGIAAHRGMSRPSLCPSAGRLAGWSGRLAGETQRWLLEPKLTERVVCGSVWPWRSELRCGCWASRLHRHPVVSWGTVTRPLSQEAPGLPQRLLEGPRGRGAPPRTGSRCFAGLEPGSLRVGEELAAVGSARAACAVF